MKNFLAVSFAAILVLGAVRAFLAPSTITHHNGKEWTMTTKVPPCTSSQNLQVIWPRDSNGTVTIECDNLQ